MKYKGLSAFILLCLCWPVSVFAALTIPPGFNAIEWGREITVYEKNYGNRIDYVAVADLSKGAKFGITTGDKGDIFPSERCDGLPDPNYYKLSIGDHVNRAVQQSDLWWVAITGSPSMPGYNPSRLSFGIKQDGTIEAGGYEGEAARYLQVFNSKADISPEESYCVGLTETTAPDVAGGWIEDGMGRPGDETRREAAAIVDNDPAPGYEILLFFGSNSCRAADIWPVLQSFGAEKALYFDGGSAGSMQTKGGVKFASGIFPSALHLFEASECISPIQGTGQAFRVKDPGGNTLLAVFHNGDIGLKGVLEVNCGNAPGNDDFVINSPGENAAAWVNRNTGDLCIRGDVTCDQTAIYATTESEFYVKNKDDHIVALWSASGELKILGKIEENKY